MSFGEFQKNDLLENYISFQTTKNHSFELLQYLKNKNSDPNVVQFIFTLGNFVQQFGLKAFSRDTVITSSIYFF